MVLFKFIDIVLFFIGILKKGGALGLDTSTSLLNEIRKFKLWAIDNGGHYGEWETNYEHWESILLKVKELLSKEPIEKWSLELVNSFLYIIARNNEDEHIIEFLVEYHPVQLVSLAHHSLTYPDFEARWQIAYGLGEIQYYDIDELRELLTAFMTKDPHEYVKRRAAIAYGRQGL